MEFYNSSSSSTTTSSSLEEEAGSFLASLKRDRDIEAIEQLTKKSRPESYVPVAEVTTGASPAQPYPFFNYVDHSRDADPDPYVPLTAPGRVPNFPAKMHAILCRPDLAEIVCWEHHGRAWKVLKPREFEIRVIPKYFEHAKFSSFIRQANGWGFRRITTGRDRNAYYHPQFLRGLPHLCKGMKRPGVAEKVAADPDKEPDLAKISEMYPVPLKPADEETIMLPCVLQHGPKARMTVQSLSSLANAPPPQQPQDRNNNNFQVLSPNDHESLASFQQTLGGGIASHNAPAPAPQNRQLKPGASLTSYFPMMMMPANGNNQAHILAAANKMAWQSSGSSSPHMFAAGFAAAMAQNLHQQPR